MSKFIRINGSDIRASLIGWVSAPEARYTESHGKRTLAYVVLELQALGMEDSKLMCFDTFEEANKFRDSILKDLEESCD